MPLLNDDEIKAAVRNQRIRALTVDTTVFHRLGYDLNALSLRPLAQFFGSNVAFVLSDVVVGEVCAHLAENAAAQNQRAVVAIRDMERAGRVDPAASARAASALGLDNDVVVEIAQRWQCFLTDYAPLILDAKTSVDGGKLLVAYFAGAAPFGAGKKKDEFPDAIALQELEAFAAENDGLVLAVSHDGDWQAYATQSPRVIVVDDFARAIAHFVDPGAWTADQLSGLLALEHSAIAHDVMAALDDYVRQVRPEIFAHSTFEMEAEFLDARILTFDPTMPEQVAVIEADSSTALVAFPLIVSLEIDAGFGFFAYNPDVEVYDGVGAADATVEHSVDVRIVARIPRDLKEDDRAAEIRVEAPTRFPVHFGEVRPDFGHH